jgi:2-polyprenyl-6-methoxyphenol hydroxylase-like FAD-dependent oxidoreductase
MIPPVTGNGMSMAFESAELALEPLAAYSRGQRSWPEAQQTIAAGCDATFARRLAWARLVQWLMFNPLLCGGAGSVLLGSEALWRRLFAWTR